ncbi:hypothetical protein EC9_25890 [Rosistilla ulvae]|uniref:Legionella pneumophila major outer membrane protein n=1 Tax=Rosistilla ulvae TaxID=1930277 RepID=A0A517M0N8_9BACT|nr:BBP7 family outer membrane beta-barrel protein [Rosistilla ulvae]QDS88399.1 hypothetical protein EC9_25890 [Rosistilla ulvae]
MVNAVSFRRLIYTTLVFSTCFALSLPADADWEAGKYWMSHSDTFSSPSISEAALPPRYLGDAVAANSGESLSTPPDAPAPATDKTLPPPASFDPATIPRLSELEAKVLETQVLTEAQIQALLAPTRNQYLSPSSSAQGNSCEVNGTCPPSETTTPVGSSTQSGTCNTADSCPPPRSRLLPRLPSIQITKAPSATNCPPIAAPCNPRCWAHAEVLSWRLQGDRLPILVTTSPLGTAQADAGILGLPTTVPIFGGDRFDTDSRLGGRLNVGRWLRRAEGIAVEADFSFLPKEDETHTFVSAGATTLARPFYDVNPAVDAEAADLIAFDGVVGGRLTIEMESELYTGSLGMRAVSLRFSNAKTGRRVDWLSGFRYFRLAESLQIDDLRTAVATHASPYGTLDVGTTFASHDHFKTENDFYGYDLGVSIQKERGRWLLRSQAKVALGVNHQVVENDGQRTITPTVGAAVTERGGLLTGQGNDGQVSQQRFAVLPEARIELGYQVTKHLRATAGYQFLYLTEAVRPGSQVDRAANSSLLDAAVADAGPVRPGPLFESDNVYVHGGTFGLQFSY